MNQIMSMCAWHVCRQPRAGDNGHNGVGKGGEISISQDALAQSMWHLNGQ